LIEWVIERHISHVVLTDLLHILSPYHPELPLHFHTLLQTTISTVITKLETWEFCYLDLTSTLKTIIIKIHWRIFETWWVLKISFNIDGIPLFKNNKLQLWPIKNFRSTPFFSFLWNIKIETFKYFPGQFYRWIKSIIRKWT